MVAVVIGNKGAEVSDNPTNQASDGASRAVLRVDVCDVHGRKLREATVELRHIGDDAIAWLTFDEATELFVAEDVPTGEAVISVEHPEMMGRTERSRDRRVS